MTTTPALRAFIDFDEPFAGRQTLCRCWGEILLNTDEPLLAALGAISAEIPPAYPPRGLPAVASQEVFDATHLAVEQASRNPRTVSKRTADELVDGGAVWVIYDWSGRWAESLPTAGSHITDSTTFAHSWLGIIEVQQVVRALSERQTRRLRVHREDVDTVRAILSVPQRDAVRLLFGPGELAEIAVGFPGAWPTFALDAALAAMRSLEQSGRSARLVYWACKAKD